MLTTNYQKLVTTAMLDMYNSNYICLPVRMQTNYSQLGGEWQPLWFQMREMMGGCPPSAAAFRFHFYISGLRTVATHQVRMLLGSVRGTTLQYGLQFRPEWQRLQRLRFRSCFQF